MGQQSHSPTLSYPQNTAPQRTMRSSTPCSAWAQGEITTSSVKTVSSLQNRDNGLAKGPLPPPHVPHHIISTMLPQGSTGGRDPEPNS